ncbi:hypothetical protein EW146_g4201 [Bondarzewia mesenterica]|uniref:Carbonic anhydrase n=1 Tax=Bondarzewia mesenterica TaxID=1095465 RepID=A0A4S4LVA8_9AGAM|nr:hypothetical protein EW146_g4201 [Bondarzewia mesenterica]
MSAKSAPSVAGSYARYCNINNPTELQSRVWNMPGPEPTSKIAIITCMDGRLDPFRMFGLKVGEAHIIRPGGGRTSDALRSLIASEHVLHTTEIMVVHHTDCEFMRAPNDDKAHEHIDEALLKCNGVSDLSTRHIPIQVIADGDLERSVREDVQFLRTSPYIRNDAGYMILSRAPSEKSLRDPRSIIPAQNLDDVTVAMMLAMYATVLEFHDHQRNRIGFSLHHFRYTDYVRPGLRLVPPAGLDKKGNSSTSWSKTVSLCLEAIPLLSPQVVTSTMRRTPSSAARVLTILSLFFLSSLSFTLVSGGHVNIMEGNSAALAAQKRGVHLISSRKFSFANARRADAASVEPSQPSAQPSATQRSSQDAASSTQVISTSSSSITAGPSSSTSVASSSDAASPSSFSSSSSPTPTSESSSSFSSSSSTSAASSSSAEFSSSTTSSSSASSSSSSPSSSASSSTLSSSSASSSSLASSSAKSTVTASSSAAVKSVSTHDTIATATFVSASRVSAASSASIASASQTSTSGAASTGFFANRSAVAGTFAGVGIAALLVIGGVIFLFVRKRNAARELDDEDFAYFEKPTALSDNGDHTTGLGGGPLGMSATDVAMNPYVDRDVHYANQAPYSRAAPLATADVYNPTDYGIAYPPGTEFPPHAQAYDAHGQVAYGEDPQQYAAYDPYAVDTRERQPSPRSSGFGHPFADPSNAMHAQAAPPVQYPHGASRPAPGEYEPSLDSFYGVNSAGIGAGRAQ